jgi:uncharacterized protein (DUF1330 family)
MAAYFIANVNVKDPVAYQEYVKAVPATITQYGGKFLARGGRHETLEGEWKPARLIILEFPSMEQLKRWYESEEYRPLKAIRLKHATADLVVVEGV